MDYQNTNRCLTDINLIPLYQGFPGKELYDLLISNVLSLEEVSNLSRSVARYLPSIPRKRCSHYSSFLRYAYGCDEKNGTLMSQEQRSLWIEQKRDWTHIIEFMKLVCNELEGSNNLFGLCLCREMMGHRLSDMAVITSDLKYLEEAIILYNWCASTADKIEAHKNAFSAWYWPFLYLSLLKPNDQRCIPYFCKFIEAINKHARTKFIGKKIKKAICAMKKISLEEWEKFTCGYEKIVEGGVRMVVSHIIREIQADANYCCTQRKGEKWFK
jgi:hypothetical protein